MSNLPDAERDACEVARALLGLAARLRGSGVQLDDETQVLLTLAEDGGLAAGRVLAYLRGLRGPGDGDAVAVAPRLGPWREWVPPQGHLFSDRGVGHRGLGQSVEEVRNQPRRGDPGE